jgi:hypothetical protein
MIKVVFRTVSLYVLLLCSTIYLPNGLNFRNSTLKKKRGIWLNYTILVEQQKRYPIKLVNLEFRFNYPIMPLVMKKQLFDLLFFLRIRPSHIFFYLPHDALLFCSPAQVFAAVATLFFMAHATIGALNALLVALCCSSRSRRFSMQPPSCSSTPCRT